MNRIKLKRLKQKSLSDDEIFNALKGHTRIFLYRDIINAYDIDDLFGPYDSVVLLYEKEPQVGHWVALLRNNDVIEFFDSYGMFPESEKDYIDQNFIKMSGQRQNKLAQLLHDAWYIGYRVEYNNYDLQVMKDGVSTCGRHVISRIWNKHLNIDEYNKFINSFRNEGLNPDDVVSIITKNV
jgi:hypothetical protein